MNDYIKTHQVVSQRRICCEGTLRTVLVLDDGAEVWLDDREIIVAAESYGNMFLLGMLVVAIPVALYFVIHFILPPFLKWLLGVCR